MKLTFVIHYKHNDNFRKVLRAQNLPFSGQQRWDDYHYEVTFENIVQAMELYRLYKTAYIKTILEITPTITA